MYWQSAIKTEEILFSGQKGLRGKETLSFEGQVVVIKPLIMICEGNNLIYS